jgi:hypothetical protein
MNFVPSKLSAKIDGGGGEYKYTYVWQGGGRVADQVALTIFIVFFENTHIQSVDGVPDA